MVERDDMGNARVDQEGFGLAIVRCQKLRVSMSPRPYSLCLPLTGGPIYRNETLRRLLSFELSDVGRLRVRALPPCFAIFAPLT